MVTDQHEVDARHMQRAIDAARLGWECDVNPRVGCVLVSAQGSVVAVGHHRGAGHAHAEIEALNAAGDAARGSVAYVTLEPCHHRGRTGPCTVALTEAGVARVVVAVSDPNPAASGGGAWLEERGIPVTRGVLADEGEHLNRTWLHRQRTGRPFVTWKTATTLDGRISAADGSSRWITGEESRRDVHALRARCGAVVVGTGTARADRPALTVRGLGHPDERQPMRVVVGARGTPALPQEPELPVLRLAERDPSRVLAALSEKEIHHVLLEGGPTLAAAFVRAGLVDEVVAYVAPVLLGSGEHGVADLGIETISEALRLTTIDVTPLGDDVRITAVPLRDKETH